MRIERGWWAVGAFTLVQFGFWMREYGPHLAFLTDYALRILHGHPDWRAVQSRLLAPFILIYGFGWLPAPLATFTLVFIAL